MSDKKIIFVSLVNKARLVKIKEELGLNSIDAVVNHLLNSAYEEWGDDLRGMPPVLLPPKSRKESE